MRRAVLSALLLLACGEEEATTPVDVVADIEVLRLLMIDDPAVQPLEEVERVAEDRPYEAARLLRTGVLPGARRQVERAERAEVGSREGQRLRRRLVRGYRDRLAALQDYRAVLEDGARDPDALLGALRAQSAADRALLEVDAEMERLAPTGTREPPEAPPAR